MATYTRWYREGTVTVTKNSTAVVGKDTLWLTAGLNPGDIFSIDGVTDYEIASITDNTHIRLKTAYKDSSATATQYHVIRNFTATTSAQFAAQSAALYTDLQRYWDSDTQTLIGKSAYDIACEQGFSGTKAQWLESLKAGGELTEVKNTQAGLVSDVASANTNIAEINAKLDTFYRGINRNNLVYSSSLGSVFTEEHQQAIANSTFEGMYLGSRWNIPGTTAMCRIIGFNHFLMVQNYSIGGWVGISPHVVVEMYYVKDDTWTSGKFYSYDEADGDDFIGQGFLGTHVYKVVMPHFLEVAEGFFGADHIQAMRTQICDALGSNLVPSHYTVMEQKIFMMTGAQIIGNSYYNDRSMYGTTMMRQFPYFRYNLPSHGDNATAGEYGIANITPGTYNFRGANHNYDDMNSQANRYKFYLLIK